MAQYKPDAWVIVELWEPEARYHRVLGGWYGGFAGSDNWRLSSGITRIEKEADVWKIHNESGSIYYCHPNAERTTSLTASVLNNLSGNEIIGSKQVQLQDILKLYNK